MNNIDNFMCIRYDFTRLKDYVCRTKFNAMNYLNLITLSLILLFTRFSFSQNFDLQWSDKKEYTNGKDGFFKYFLGSNENYVYSIYNNLTTSRKKATKSRVDIVAMDKNTMKDVHKVQLRGKEDPNRKVALEGKDYLRTIVLEDVIYVFWTKVEKNTTEIYAESKVVIDF